MSEMLQAFPWLQTGSESRAEGLEARVSLVVLLSVLGALQFTSEIQLDPLSRYAWWVELGAGLDGLVGDEPWRLVTALFVGGQSLMVGAVAATAGLFFARDGRPYLTIFFLGGWLGLFAVYLTPDVPVWFGCEAGLWSICMAHPPSWQLPGVPKTSDALDEQEDTEDSGLVPTLCWMTCVVLLGSQLGASPAAPLLAGLGSAVGLAFSLSPNVADLGTLPKRGAWVFVASALVFGTLGAIRAERSAPVQAQRLETLLSHGLAEGLSAEQLSIYYRKSGRASELLEALDRWLAARVAEGEAGFPASLLWSERLELQGALQASIELRYLIWRSFGAHGFDAVLSTIDDGGGRLYSVGQVPAESSTQFRFSLLNERMEVVGQQAESGTLFLVQSQGQTVGVLEWPAEAEPQVRVIPDGLFSELERGASVVPKLSMPKPPIEAPRYYDAPSDQNRWRRL